MALIKWMGEDVLDPFHELAGFPVDVNRLFGRALFPAVSPKNGGKWLPEVDITEEKDRLVVRADLPGMKQEDISVELGDGTLTIKGDRKHEAETKDAKTYRIERSYGSFLRSFTIPAGIDTTKVNAAYKNGVLEVTLPKLAEAKAKQVKVEVK
jgi:HSP20 family protein